MSKSIKSDLATKPHVIGKEIHARHARRIVKSALKRLEFDEDTVLKTSIRKFKDKYHNFFKRYLAS